MMSMKKMFVLITQIILLSACGTKGPLYIPEERYPQESKFDNFNYNSHEIA